MSKVLIVYATRSDQSRQIAGLIAEGIRLSGHEADVVNVTEAEKQGIDPAGYDALLLGSATYHGDMLQPMKTYLFRLENSELEGKVGGAFGAYGWSGEALQRIYDTMNNIYKMDMVSGPLMLKSAELGGAIQMAHAYGKEVIQKLGG
jgi:flavorubredoxin